MSNVCFVVYCSALTGTPGRVGALLQVLTRQFNSVALKKCLFWQKETDLFERTGGPCTLPSSILSLMLALQVLTEDIELVKIIYIPAIKSLRWLISL